MHRGYTSYKATGGFSGDEKTVMLCILNRGEALKLKYQVKQTDPEAFVIITDTNEILGKGFQSSD